MPLLTRSLTTRLTATLCVAGASMLFASLADAADKVFDKKLSTTPGGTLSVDTQTGSIAVTGADVREVTVHATLRGSESDLKEFEITADADSHGVTIHGGKPGARSWFRGDHLHVKYEIQVPREYGLDLRTAGGDIDARTLKGDIKAHTSGGDVKLASITGAIDLHTSGGDIDASQLTGNTLLRTSGGRITATDTHGDLDIQTSGGNIRLQSVDGKVSARTSGGDIDADLRGANQGTILKTSGGDIKIAVPSDYKATLDAHTSGGRVSCDLPLLVQNANTEKSNLRGEINGGGPTLSAQSSGGSIHIRAR